MISVRTRHSGIRVSRPEIGRYAADTLPRVSLHVIVGAPSSDKRSFQGAEAWTYSRSPAFQAEKFPPLPTGVVPIMILNPSAASGKGEKRGAALVRRAGSRYPDLPVPRRNDPETGEAP